MKRLLLVAAVLAGLGGGFHNWTSPAHAAGVCNTETATSPNIGGGVITDVHTSTGHCPQAFDVTVLPQAESGGTWHAWYCGGSIFCQLLHSPGPPDAMATDTVSTNNLNWDPTGSPDGLDPNHLCAYRERIKVEVYHYNGSGYNFTDQYASAAIPVSC